MDVRAWLRDAIVASGWDSLISLIPSERALEHRATPNGDDSSTRLRRSLVGVTGQFDLVLIDCPPSLGELTRNALYAATDALVVTEPSFFAVNGAERGTRSSLHRGKHGNPGLRPIGIVANRVRPTLPEHNYRMDELRSAFGDLVLGGLPDRAAIQQAQGACVPVQRWTSNGAADINTALSRLLDELRPMSRPVGDSAAGARPIPRFPSPVHPDRRRVASMTNPAPRPRCARPRMQTCIQLKTKGAATVNCAAPARTYRGIGNHPD